MRRLVWLVSVCAAIAACSADGNPRRGGGGGGSDGGGGGGMDSGGGSGLDAGGGRDAIAPAADAACERIDVAAEPGTANVLIVLDRSGSMYDMGPFGSGVDRWTPAVMAINTATSALEDRIQFGLMLFPGNVAVDQCSAGMVRVACGPMNASSIMAELSGDPSALVGGGTPIAASLMAARTALASLEGDSYVLLVTDGAPNCNGALDGASCRCTGPSCFLNNLNCLDDVNAVAAVEALAAAGIGTYVIGYDTAGWADVLDAMAAAGDTGRATHFPVGDRASLETTLRDIGGSVVSCTYELAMPPGDVRYVRVTVDGTDVPHESVSGDGNGWVLEGDRTVTLVGAPCDDLKDGESHDISIVVECEPVIF